MPREQQPADDFEKLARELDALRRRLDTIDDRLEKIEGAAERAIPPVSQRAQPPAPRPGPMAEREGEIIEDAEIVEAELSAGPLPPVEQRPAASVSPPPSYPTYESTPPPYYFDEQVSRAWESFSGRWEEIVAGRWLTWAGALTLIVAMAFFVPWAWTELDLPDWSKVLMLHLLGAGLGVAAWVLHRRELKIFAQGLAGIGIFTLYASAWAAEHHYEIWGDAGEAITFVECTIITALAIAAAVAARSVAIILLGALGGYLTPIIASAGTGNHVALFTYLAFLNVALCGTAVLRGWSFLKPIALAATIVMFAAWLASGAFDAETDTWSTQWLLTLHGGIFLVASTLPPLAWARRSDWLGLAALTANSLWYVGTTWLLFHDRPGQQLALVCWGMTVLHLALFGMTFQRLTNIDRMPRVQLALAAVFFILAMPLQLEDSLSYLALAWSAQGVALTAVAIYFRDRQMCVTSLIVFGLALLRLFAFDFTASPELIGQIAHRFLMFCLTALMMIVAGALYPLWGRLFVVAGFIRPSPPQDAMSLGPAYWEPIGGMLMGIGNVVAMIGLTLQWDSRLVLLLWTLDAAAIWAIGFALRRPAKAAHYEPPGPAEADHYERRRYNLSGAAVRTYALGLAVVMVGARCLYHGDRVGGTFALLLNDRFGTLALVAAVFFAAAWAYRKLVPPRGSDDATADAAGAPAGELSPMERWLDSPIAVLANLVLVAALSMEIQSWYREAAAAGYQPFADMRMAAQASYSVLWAVYAALAFVFGLWLRWPVLRYVGLSGLALTLWKVFFFDLASLELLPRVVALAVLGMMLLAVSFLYQRFRRQAQAA